MPFPCRQVRQKTDSRDHDKCCRGIRQEHPSRFLHGFFLSQSVASNIHDIDIANSARFHQYLGTNSQRISCLKYLFHNPDVSLWTNAAGAFFHRLLQRFDGFLAVWLAQVRAGHAWPRCVVPRTRVPRHPPLAALRGSGNHSAPDQDASALPPMWFQAHLAMA